MNTGDIVTAAREMMGFVLLLSTPFLLAAVAASLAIGLIQAATRMNDLTLSFVPRFFAVLLVLFLVASWAGARMTAYLERSAMAAERLHE
ncbi:MAG TPA: flagellar biosynthetic protein FliQ [Stellaceae bacterium]|jgi:flagellar biosynthetic protein FliQ|nr:flagellar biosynthetic protein FliQ [Stellaceae bacterium]